MSETFENLTVSRDGPIAQVTFNRPEKANALNTPHLEDIEAAALSFREDAQTRVVVFTGAGKHFSSGAGKDHEAASTADDGRGFGQVCRVYVRIRPHRHSAAVTRRAQPCLRSRARQLGQARRRREGR